MEMANSCDGKMEHEKCLECQFAERCVHDNPTSQGLSIAERNELTKNFQNNADTCEFSCRCNCD